MPRALAQPALAIEAVARGDQLFVIADAPPAGDEAFWLAPSSAELATGELTRSWIGEEAHDRSIRCRCTPAGVISLTAERAAALAPLGVWNAEALAARAGAAIVVVRAEVAVEGAPAGARATAGSWLDVVETAPGDGLLPALTDEAFALQRERLLAAAR
jgi:hypothetical protein